MKQLTDPICQFYISVNNFNYDTEPSESLIFKATMTLFLTWMNNKIKGFKDEEYRQIYRSKITSKRRRLNS
jgi:hypothetical protein